MKEYYFEIPFCFAHSESKGFAFWQKKVKEKNTIEEILFKNFNQVWKNYNKYPQLSYKLANVENLTYTWIIFRKENIIKKTLTESFTEGKVYAKVVIRIIPVNK